MSNYEYINDTGVIVPDTSDTLESVKDEYRVALGQDIQTTPDTPQGALIVAETTSRQSVIRSAAQLANQINPRESGGRFLDALCAMLELYRFPETFTQVQGVEVGGEPQTVLPAGSRAKTGAGDVFETISTVQLDTSGNATVSFRAVLGGPVQCAVGELTTPVDMVLGWERVTNPVAGVLGQYEESDTKLRKRREVTLALNTRSTREAIKSALNAMVDVRSMVFRENIAATTEVIDGVTMVPHSIWVCVYGGSDSQVAMSLLENKTDGAAWNGAVTVPTVDPSSDQTYNVLFDRAEYVPVLVELRLRAGTYVGNATAAAPAAVLKYASGEIPDMQGFVVGAMKVSPFDIGAAVSEELPGIQVASVKVSRVGGTMSSDELALTIKECATVTINSVSVVLI